MHNRQDHYYYFKPSRYEQVILGAGVLQPAQKAAKCAALRILQEERQHERREAAEAKGPGPAVLWALRREVEQGDSAGEARISAQGNATVIEPHALLALL